MMPLETPGELPDARDHLNLPAPRPRRHLGLFRTAAGAMLALYSLLMLVGLLLAWFKLFGILPVLLLTAAVFGLMHGAYRMVIEDEDDDGPLDDLERERHGRRRRKVVFFI